MPRWDTRAPVITDGFGSPRPGGIRHGGVDIMYLRAPTDTFKPRTANGSWLSVMPDNTAALAASDGVVWSAMKTPRGFAVVIDHGPTKAATFYTHLEQLFVKETANAKAGERVRAGQEIGIIGADPLDQGRLKHMHFELWLGGPSDAVDPSYVMPGWEVVNDPRRATLARNVSLTYRPIGARGEPYPNWIRELDGKSGVYVIREPASDGTVETVYVGESHTNRLYDTLTRHFQTWRRWKGFWKGQYGEGHDPGLTYDRGRVEVAVRVTSPSVAIDEEARLITRLRPRDNLLGQPAEDDVPF
ncbi:MAG: M23 family metallopeptidase [Proteobacteria bacterium]|nr:M23 family metallopeptidase [Pseudomonadota bacterium]